MKDSVTLVLDTSTEACVVGVSTRGRFVERSWEGPREHAERVLPMVQDALQALDVSMSEVEVIGVARGPGSFTGVRLGVCVAQGLAMAVGARVYPLSTLAVIAQVAADRYGRDWVLAAIDARMGEVYAAAFRRGPDGRMAIISDEVVCAPEQLSMLLTDLPTRGYVGAGTGWCYEDILKPQFKQVELVDKTILPTASALDKLVDGAVLEGGGLDAADVQPVYLRNDVADPNARKTPPFDLNAFLSSLSQ